MAAKNFTLYNYSSTTATLNQITFETPAGIQHIANLSAFGGYLAGASAFTGTGTYPVETATYQEDTRPENATYVAHYNTLSNFYLIVDSTTRIKAGWDADGNGYTSGQTVVSVTSSTWLRMSAAPTFPPTVGQAITFSTPDIELTVDSTAGISAGFVAVGNGYSIGQTVVSVLSGSVLQMSAYPNGIPSIGGTINFENRSPIGTLAPGASIPFSVDHTTSLTSVNTYTARIEIIGDVNGPKTKVVRNAILLSTAPVTDPGNIFFDPGGGGGDTGPASCTDSSSVSCSASGAGGGGECFRKGTLISMFDGTFKNIEDVVVGDRVLSANGKQVNTVKYVEHSLTQGTSYQTFYAPKGMKPFATENHPMVVDNKWVSANAKLTQKLYPWIETGQLEEFDTEPTNSQVVWNLWVDGDHTYQVNGFGTNSLVDDGGWLRLSVEQGYMTKEQITEVTHGVSKSSSTVAYGALILSNLVAYIDRPWLTKYVADMMLGKKSRRPMDLAIITVGFLAMSIKKIKNLTVA